MAEEKQKAMDSHLFAEDIRDRERRRRTQTPIWQILSFLLHGFGFVVLILCTPLREAVIPEPKDDKPVQMSAEKLEAISENIQEIHLNELLEQLEELQIVLHNMDKMKNDILKDYDAFAENEQEAAQDELEDLFEKAIESQTNTVAQQERVEQLAKDINALQAQKLETKGVSSQIKEAYDSKKKTFEQLDTAQAVAQNLLDQANVKAELAGLKKTTEASAVARDVQLDANTMQREARQEMASQVNTMQSYTKTLSEISKKNWEVSKTESTIKSLETKIANYEAAIQANHDRIAKANTDIEQSEQKLAELKPQREAAAAEVKTAENELKQANSAAAQASSTKRSADASLKTAQSANTAAQRALAAAQRKAKSGKADVVAAAKKAEEKASKAAETVDVRKEAVQAAAVALAEKQEAVRESTEAVKQAKAEATNLANQNSATVKALDAAKKALSTNKSQLVSNDKRKEHEEGALARAKGSLRKAVDALPPLELRKSKQEEIARTAETSMLKNQQDATTAQKALIEKVKEIAELAKQEQAEQEKLAQEEYKPQDITMESVAQLDMVDSYELAKQLEELVTESYREIKSAEAAMLTKMSFQSAAKLTDVAKTVRPEIDAKLLREAPKNQERFEKQKAETVKVIQETNNILEASKMLMAAAAEIVQPEGADSESGEHTQDARLQRMYDLASLNEQLSEAAAEDASELAKDMSQLMAQTSAESSSEESADKDSESEAEEEAEEAAQSEKLAQAASSGVSKTPLFKGFTGDIPELFPGNVISLASGSEGIPAEWMYINSWYVIGPFPNPNRVNLMRRFAPETIVDLEATYIGKDDKPVKWEFEQARSSDKDKKTRALIIPQSAEAYGIWYAYSEVFLDQDADLWIAVGSDDRSDLWINDMHVWGSSNELKSWGIKEGFRKVHFKKGRNRLMTRIENGWHSLGWSVCISLSEEISMK